MGAEVSLTSTAHSLSDLQLYFTLGLIWLHFKQKEGAKVEGEKKPAADAGVKKDDGVFISVYKMDIHCEGCAKKIRHAVRHLDGNICLWLLINLFGLDS